MATCSANPIETEDGYESYCILTNGHSGSHDTVTAATSGIASGTTQTGRLS